MPAYYSFRNSEGQEFKPTFDQPAPPFPAKEVAESIYDFGKSAVQNTVGDMVVPAPWRGWQSENEGRKRDAVGSGKGVGEGVSSAVDTLNTVTQMAGDLGPVGRIKPSIAKDFLDPSFLRGTKLNPKSTFGRVGTNMGIGFVLGTGANAAGEIVGNQFDDVSEQMRDLRIARYAGDDELANRIMENINSRRTYASDARTMGDAVSKGTNAGWWGTATGAVGGAIVSGLRHAMGGEKHMEGADPKFLAEMKRRRAESMENAFSVEGSDFDPRFAVEALNENLRRYKDRESIHPELDSEEDLQLQRTIRNAYGYLKSNRGKGEEFDKLEKDFTEGYFALMDNQKNKDLEAMRGRAKELREQYK